MRTREINAIVDRAYSALDVLNNITWTGYRDRCYNMACAEERGHRQGAPVGWTWPKGASVNAAARMFVVKRIAEALVDPEHAPTIAGVISMQPSAVYAASIVANYGAKCRKALEGMDLKQLADLDYVAFVNNGQTEAA